ncbi:MAG: ATP-binding protein [Bacteroidota bacterium]
MAISEKHAAFWFANTKELLMLFAVEEKGGFRLISANGACERFVSRYGDPTYPSNVIGKDIKDILCQNLRLSEPEADYKIRLYRRCVDEGKPFSFEEKTRIEGLGEVVALTSIAPIFDDYGKVHKISYTAFDVSAFRKAVKKLEETNTVLKEAQQLAHIGVWRWNAEVGSFDWSANMRQIFGVGKDENPVFDEWVDMVHPDDVQQVRTEIETAFAEKRSFAMDHKIIRRDGALRFLSLWGDLRISEGGEIREVFGLCRDRTEEQMAEDRLLAAVLKAEDEARQNIARELHDGLGQNLTTALLNLNILSREQDQLSDKGQQRLQTAAKYLNMGMEETRKLAHTLMPQAVIEFGFVLTLQNLINALQNEQLKIEFYHYLPEERSFPPKIALSLYRICQEALQNIIKHAQATEVNIQFLEQADLLQLTIEDNGVGFEPDHQHHGYGLNNMRTRTQALGGLLFIESHPGKGSIITVQIPTEKQIYGSLENTAG